MNNDLLADRLDRVPFATGNEWELAYYATTKRWHIEWIGDGKPPRQLPTEKTQLKPLNKHGRRTVAPSYMANLLDGLDVQWTDFVMKRAQKLLAEQHPQLMSAIAACVAEDLKVEIK